MVQLNQLIFNVKETISLILQDPEKTNEFLQALAKLIDTRTDTSAAVRWKTKRQDIKTPYANNNNNKSPSKNNNNSSNSSASKGNKSNASNNGSRGSSKEGDKNERNKDNSLLRER